MTLLWSSHVKVKQAISQSGVGASTAVDYYSMCREVAECVMSHEVESRPLGGAGSNFIRCQLHTPTVVLRVSG